MSDPWHIDWLELRVTAWEVTRGRGVEIALLDSGVAVVGDLDRRRVERLSERGARTRRGDRSHDGHGTAAAGVLVADDEHVLGVAPEAKLVSIDVCSTAGSPAPNKVAAGFELAAARGFDVVCCPFTLPRVTRKLREAIAAAVSAGVVIVAAAGNDDAIASEFPESIDGLITVAGLRERGSLLHGARTGDWTTIAAPGEDLRTWGVDGRVRRDFRGSSAAAPVVAGVVGLGLSHVRALRGAPVARREAANLVARLRETGKPITGTDVLAIDVDDLFESLS